MILLSGKVFSQISIEKGDPPNNTNIPDFYKGTLKDIEDEIRMMRKGKVKVVTNTTSGLPVYAVFYGEKPDFSSQANYNSAVAAGNAAFFARKDSTTKPVVFFLGPVHGQEAEGIAGLVNFIHVAETGKDYRGKIWTELKNKVDKCRVIIIPCGNPEGRKRCPYDSFVGLPVNIMTKYGQGTHKDGTNWDWPQVKATHPMKGDVGILGAYFNDDGINMMHDDFFSPMAKETKAFFDIARVEAPDITVSLHSHGNPPEVYQTEYLPWFMKKRIEQLARNVNNRYKNAGLAHVSDEQIGEPSIEDQTFPPLRSFNLTSALHHVSGTMSFFFECPHGTTTPNTPKPIVTYSDILDIQLIAFEEILDYAIKNRLYLK